MKTDSKQGIAYMKLVTLIIGVVFLIIMIFYIRGNIEAVQYEESLIECNQFFKAINGKPLYFSEKYDQFTPKLTDTISRLCDSKEIEVSSKNVKPALDLMQDCWFKTGSGTDFLPLIATDMKLCFYCGKIKAKGDIKDFKSKINEELKKNKYSSLTSKDSEIINLNFATFEHSIPETFEDDRELTLFYYIYKPPVELNGTLKGDLKLWAKDVINRGLRDFVGENMDVGPSLNYYMLDELMVGELVKTNGGLVLIPQEELQEDDFENINNKISARDCYVVYPIDNHK